MDIISHGLWAGAAFKAVNKIEKPKKTLNVWLGVFWGVMPDLVSFGALFVWIGAELLLGGLKFSDLPVHMPQPDVEPAAMNTLPIVSFTAQLYRVSHSAIVFLAVFGLALLIWRRPIWEMTGWLIHILIDIPTHSYQFYPTPFLWPVSGWKFNGYSWSQPWFIFANYSALVIVYLILKNRKNVKKIILAVLGIALTAGLLWATVFYWQNLRGIWPSIGKPPQDISKLIGTGLPASFIS